MAFTKKTWVPGEKISAANLNRIETGIDDVYNQNVILEGDKLFDNALIVDYNPNSAKLIMSPGGVDKAKFEVTTSGVDIITSGIVKFSRASQLLAPPSYVAPLELKTINAVIPEAHASRHMFGGADFVARAADIIVDAGGDGDYTTLAAAVAACSVGDVIHVKKGSYTETISSIPANVTIIGSGNETIITLSSTTFTVNNDFCTIANLKLKGSISILMTISSDKCLIFGVELEGIGSGTDGIRIQSGNKFNKIVGCTIINADSEAIEVLGDFNTVIGCNVIDGVANTYYGIYLNGDGNKALYNIVEATTSAGAAGVVCGSSAELCIVEGNTVTAGYYGIGLVAGANECVVKANNVRAATTAGISDSGTGTEKYANIT